MVRLIIEIVNEHISSKCHFLCKCSYLNTRGGKVRYLKLDIDWRFSLGQISIHTWQEEVSLHQIFLSSWEWLDGPHGCTLLWHVLAVAWAWCVMDRNIMFNIFYYQELFWILVSQHHWELECKSPRCWLWTSSWTGTWPWPWSPPWSGRGALSQTPPRSRASHGCSILQEYFDITSLLSSVTPPYL